MHSDTAFREGFARTARAIAEWLRQREPGLVLSVDIGGSTFDAIVFGAANFSNNEFISAPSRLRHRALMLDRGQSINPSDVSTTFGKHDGYMQDNEQSDYWDEGGKLQARSIDSWLQGRNRPNLIHLGDPELLFDHIEGAASVIRSYRPLLTLYPAGQDRTKLLSLLAALGYTVVDLSLATVRDAGALSPTDFGWIALPEEREGSRVLAGEAEDRLFDAALTWSPLEYSEALPRQRRSSAVFNLGVGEVPRLRYKVAAPEIVCCSGCYPVEADGEKFWRWLGPRPHSRIAVPCPLPGSYIVEVAAIGASAVERMRDCRVLAEGKEVRLSTDKVVEGRLNFVAHLDWLKYSGYIEIDLITLSCRSPTGTDPRTLRLCLDSVAVSPCN
jgi:hypothetical protein